MTRKPYLASIGLSIPLLGVRVHWYVPVRRYWRLRTLRAAGVTVIATSYRRLDEDAI